jgi:hypothetical protein
MFQMKKPTENRPSKIGNAAIDNRKSAMVKYELALDVLRSFGEARLPVTGASMLPSIWPGDILEVRAQRPRADQPCHSDDRSDEESAFEDLKEQQIPLPRLRDRNDSGGGLAICPGEIVLFARQGRLVAHRVLRKIYQQEGLFLLTRGDRLRKPDPPVSPEELLGRVTAIVRGDRRIAPRLTLWSRAASWVFSHSDIATRLVLWVRGQVRDVKCEG